MAYNTSIFFKAADPGIVKTQIIANGSFTEFNCEKTEK